MNINHQRLISESNLCRPVVKHKTRYPGIDFYIQNLLWTNRPPVPEIRMNLVQKMIRASMLDIQLYEEVEKEYGVKRADIIAAIEYAAF